MRVFLDTNVIVSAVATRGLCEDVVREVLTRHELVICEALLGEVKAVLRTKLGVPAKAVSDVLSLLKDGSDMAAPAPSTEVSVHDPVDRALVSAALEGNADLFVTGDAELLALGRSGRLAIVSPRTFWEKARAGSP